MAVVETSADLLRRYGVPLYQKGAIPIEGTNASYFAPAWAPQLIVDWPLGADSADFDHSLLKFVIRRIVRTGDSGFATVALSVAALGGSEGVRVLLGTDIDWKM